MDARTISRRRSRISGLVVEREQSARSFVHRARIGHAIVGKRGKIPAPAPGTQIGSVIMTCH
jgi:hypothetical protein